MDMITIPWQMILLCGMSLCVGWGIRGNFGHEYGAALPGALAAMAIVLLSGREDWWRYVHYFALFGAIGWSFGGSMSYMQVVGYTHSSHSPTVLYGFANLFVIGFLWASLGGAGTALPAFLTGLDQNQSIPTLSCILSSNLCCFHWVVAASCCGRSHLRPETHATTREPALLV